MIFNVILGGVGGQGILTIAQAITHSAARRGLRVAQSEVHGMSQRGGAVQSHVRLTDGPSIAGLIPLGEADLILAAEPLEALRYVQYLRPRTGAIVSSSAPVAAVTDYPPLESLLARIARSAARHVILDAPKLARQSGSARAENIVILGAAAPMLPIASEELLGCVDGMFAAKGEHVVEVNRRAFEAGFAAARGALAECESAAASVGVGPSRSGAEAGIANAARAVTSLREIGERRSRLFEHEVYELIRSYLGIVPPVCRFVPGEQPIDGQLLGVFSGDRVVLKLVSEDIVHKSDAGAVAVVPLAPEVITARVREMLARGKENGRRVAGVLVVEHVAHPQALGGELFVGVRNTREFGPVIAAGLGGTGTEYLADRLRRERAVATAVVLDSTPETFRDIFSRTAAGEIVCGRMRGRERSISDESLLECFRGWFRLATECCIAERPDEMVVDEIEVNPFAVVDHRLVPLDGRATLGRSPAVRPPRPPQRVAKLIEPESIAVMGVSARRVNFGRIILDNIVDCGFPIDRLYVVREGVDRIAGAQCVPSLAALPGPVDLLVAAVGADQVEDIVRESTGAGDSGRAGVAESVILISAGVGERAGTESLERELRESIARSRRSGRTGEPWGPVFLGANCMGVRSRPGRYDTFFIPPDKLDARRDIPPRRVGLVSQSGAFVITRMSNLRYLDPAIAVSLGNQLDVTVSDVARVLIGRDDIECLGVYVEGFVERDGLELARVVREACERGKVVVYYKAGRTPAGRDAAQGHTASLAGDSEVCDAAMSQSGALVAQTFAEFEHLIELATLLHSKRVRGTRVAAVSNAGYEAVAMADAGVGPFHRIELPQPSAALKATLAGVFDESRVAALVNPRNPLDLTPMSTDATYEGVARALLESDEYDAAIVGCVPMSPTLLTTPDELVREGSLAARMARVAGGSNKPFVFVIDAAAPYDTLAAVIRSRGVPVFRSADAAMSALGRYLCHRMRAW